jgi:hypothetical protein
VEICSVGRKYEEAFFVRLLISTSQPKRRQNNFYFFETVVEKRYCNKLHKLQHACMKSRLSSLNSASDGYKMAHLKLKFLSK